MLTSPDFKELLAVLKKYKVRYLIVGGYAVMKYGEPRFTKDLDLLIATDPDNAQNVYRALQDFGAPLQNLAPSDFASKEHFYQMGKPPIRVDILMSIPGVEFEEIWQRRETIHIGDQELVFIGKSDLIKNKKASGRPQDLLDVSLLEQTDS